MLWGAILVIKLLYPGFPFNTFITLGLLAGSLLRLLFTNKKYLLSLSLTGDSVSIIYMSPFLRQQVIHFSADKIRHFEYEGRNWLTTAFDCLTVTVNKSSLPFMLLTKSIQQDVKDKIRSFDKQSPVTANAE
jgi:hypothetical protein